jgi:hypothetical protein
LPANFRELGSRQFWVLRSNVPRRKSDDVHLISMRLQKGQRGVRKRVIISVRADEHDGFARPFFYGYVELGLGFLRKTQADSDEQYRAD